MAIATYDYTTRDEMLATIKKRLKLTHTTSEDTTLLMHLRKAAEEMMTLLDLVQCTALIDIDCTNIPIAELPCNFVKFNIGSQYDPPIVFANDGLPITPSVDNPYYCANFNFIYEGGTFLNGSPFANFNCWNGSISIKIQNGKMYLSSNVDANQCWISFQGLNIDENGAILLPMLNARPMENFAMYQWCFDNGDPRWQHYQQVWSNTKKHRTGLANLPDVFQRQELSRIMNSLFV